MATKPEDGTFGSAMVTKPEDGSIGDAVSTRRRGGGGRLARTETVTVRLDPKTRYLAELAARKQRRTLSSFIEWAIEENLRSIGLSEEYGEENYPSRSLASEATVLWDVDEADRFAKLALRYPHMLTHDEQVLWKLIRENGYLWRGHHDEKTGEWIWPVSASSLVIENLRRYWEAFNSVVYENGDKANLPTWQKYKPDDIPF